MGIEALLLVTDLKGFQIHVYTLLNMLGHTLKSPHDCYTNLGSVVYFI
jgi:hypothetical protein